MHIKDFDSYDNTIKDKYFAVIEGFNENENDCCMIILYDADSNEFGFAWHLFEGQTVSNDDYFKKISYRFKFECYSDTLIALDENCILQEYNDDRIDTSDVEYLYNEYINRVRPWLSKDDNKELKKAYINFII